MYQSIYLYIYIYSMSNFMEFLFTILITLIFSRIQSTSRETMLIAAKTKECGTLQMEIPIVRTVQTPRAQGIGHTRVKGRLFRKSGKRREKIETTNPEINIQVGFIIQLKLQLLIPLSTNKPNQYSKTFICQMSFMSKVRIFIASRVGYCQLIKN